MSFFKILLSTDDSNKSALNDAINSVRTQTYRNYALVVAHENADTEYTMQSNGVFHTFSRDHLCNGGNRNAGMDFAFSDNFDYVLCLNDTDVLDSNTILQELHDFIARNSYPRIIRLPYRKLYVPGTKGVIKRYNGENSIEDLTASSKVAAWTKCVDNTIIKKFPVNTYFEDIPQHIAQIDAIESIYDVAYFTKPVVQNRLYNTSPEDDTTSPKYHSSRLRLLAELMDLDLKHEYSDKVRKDKIDLYAKGLFDDYQSDNSYFSNMSSSEAIDNGNDDNNDD